jgi:hypothetical protein
MCPGCVTTIALIAAGVTSTGGITTLVVSKLRGRTTSTQDRHSDLDRRDTWRNEREAWLSEREAPSHEGGMAR